MVNAALRSENRDAIKPWRHYIWLLMQALEALPSVPRNTLYRGMKVPFHNLGSNYRKGGTFQYHSFMSTSNHIDVS
jgi:hypothetical protein